MDDDTIHTYLSNWINLIDKKDNRIVCCKYCTTSLKPVATQQKLYLRNEIPTDKMYK